jgi:hypothetical protein
MNKLEDRTTRPSDGRSHVSIDSGWMGEPYEIGNGWYFEGRMSLLDKKGILESFPQLGLSSREFASCVQDFVEGKSVEKYAPTSEQARQIFEQWKREGRGNAVLNRLEEAGLKVDVI